MPDAQGGLARRIEALRNAGCSSPPTGRRDDDALEAAIGAAVADMDPDLPVTPVAEGRTFDLPLP
jgi:hypothetical protein